MSTTTSSNIIFYELKQALNALEYPHDYYEYLVKENGVESFECLDIIINDNHTSTLNRIPFGRFIMIRKQIKIIMFQKKKGIINSFWYH